MKERAVLARAAKITQEAHTRHQVAGLVLPGTYKERTLMMAEYRSLHTAAAEFAAAHLLEKFGNVEHRPTAVLLSRLQQEVLKFAENGVSFGKPPSPAEFENWHGRLSTMAGLAIALELSGISRSLVDRMAAEFVRNYLQSGKELYNALGVNRILLEAEASRGARELGIISSEAKCLSDFMNAAEHFVGISGFSGANRARALSFATPYVKKAATLYAQGKKPQSFQVLSKAQNAMAAHGLPAKNSSIFSHNMEVMIRRIEGAERNRTAGGQIRRANK